MNHREKRLDAELRFDYEQRIAQNIRAGMTEPEARRAANLAFGGIEQIKEQCRDARRFAAFDSILQDIRYAARSLRRSPAFTITAIAILAIGIGINAAVFTAAKATLFAGFPMVEHNDRIVYLTESKGCCVSYADFKDWQSQAKSFEGMGLVHGAGRLLTDSTGFAQNYDVTEVTANTFSLTGRAPLLGRDFTTSDEQPGAPAVAILTYGLWERRYGKDPAVVGRQIRLSDAPATIVGVMPRGFSFPQKQDLWVPLIPTPDVLKRNNRGTWFAFGVLAPGATLQTARAEIETIGRRLENAYPATNRKVVPVAATFNEFFLQENENIMYATMWGAVGFVLLIACANLANLMLARAMGRSHEVSVRLALGAGRWRVVRQLLIESLMLSAAGSFLGWWLARWGVAAWEAANRGPGRTSWRILDYSMDYRVLLYLVALSILTSILFGLVPARALSRLNVASALKDSARSVTRTPRLSFLLVVTEMALAVVLVAGAGVMIRSFINIYTANLGIRTANILTMSVRLPAARYPRPESFFAQIKERLAALPGVESVALADAIPAGGANRRPVEGVPGQVSIVQVDADYFRTLHAPLIAGRNFNSADTVSSPPVALVNQRLAAIYPLGQRLRVLDHYGVTPGPWLTIVGVAPDIAQNDPTHPHSEPVLYRPWSQDPGRSMDILAQTRVPPATLISAFRNETRALDPDLPVFGPVALDERLKVNYWSSELYGILFLIFAAVALLLASVGLYAVLADSVGRRTQEIGIRVAIGATGRDIRQLVLRQGALPMFIGLAAGLAASLAVNRLLKSQLVQVSPTDPVAISISCAVLILAGALGCYIPARRAARVDPLVALRHE